MRSGSTAARSSINSPAESFGSRRRLGSTLGSRSDMPLPMRSAQPPTARIGDLRFETLLTPKFRFSHDSLAALVAREYRLLTPRFGEPQAPSRYLLAVESRFVKGAGFTVRMNNAVVSGDNVTRLDEP